MWIKIAHFIFRFRLWLMLLLAAITVFLACKIPDLELSYDYIEAVPSGDPPLYTISNLSSSLAKTLT